jgi:hypothetical protein
LSELTIFLADRNPAIPIAIKTKPKAIVVSVPRPAATPPTGVVPTAPAAVPPVGLVAGGRVIVPPVTAGSTMTADITTLPVGQTAVIKAGPVGNPAGTARTALKEPLAVVVALPRLT